MSPAPVVLGWSGGKDSTLALAHLRSDPAWEVVGLITTVTPMYDRISIHGVRRELLHQQADALGLEVIEAPLEPGSSNEAYEASFLAAVARWQDRVPGLKDLAFGDLFLSDVREYREALVPRAGCSAHFPLWGEPTDRLARHFIEQGYQARLVCIDLEQLDQRFAGREYTKALLDELPRRVDPCGENGEFHTFVYGGPIFRQPVHVSLGGILVRDRVVYADLLPGEGMR